MDKNNSNLRNLYSH